MVAQDYTEVIELLQHFQKQPEVGMATRRNIQEHIAKLKVEQEKLQRAEQITSVGH